MGLTTGGFRLVKIRGVRVTGVASERRRFTAVKAKAVKAVMVPHKPTRAPAL